MKRVAVLGSTGSVGKNALEVIKRLPNKLSVSGLAADKNIELLAKQAAEFNCDKISCNIEYSQRLSLITPGETKICPGINGMIEIATDKNTDIVLCAVVGTAALMPVLEAIRAGKDIAIASKEILVMAGELVMAEARKHNVKILPVDSEHCAIFQCVENKKHSDISKIILTASGGALKNWTTEQIAKATCKDALAHPTWSMGPKITIDSASLMNKALEIIEAKWLFGLNPNQIDVVIHPQSIIHSMVEFIDGSILAQMSVTDMKFPIQYSLTYPEKIDGLKHLNLIKLKFLTFEEPDRTRFPSLDYAFHAMNVGGTMPAVMNAANELAVDIFLKNKIRFPDIWKIIEKTMSAHKVIHSPTIEQIIEADKWAKQAAINIAYGSPF